MTPPPVGDAPVVTPPVVTPPVVKPPVVTPPVVTTGSNTKCRVVSSSIKVRSLSSLLASLKKTSTVRLQVKATCSLRLTFAAALGTKHGAVVGTRERVPQEGHDEDDPGAPDRAPVAT